MATSSRSADRDIEKVESSQLFDGVYYDTAAVLRELAGRFRIACGIEPLDPTAKIHEAEAQMIFTFCYVCHNGLGADWKTRASRSLQDLYEYLDDNTRHQLPYYVIRSHQQIQEAGKCETQFTPPLVEGYKQVITLMSGPVADYRLFAKHSLSVD